MTLVGLFLILILAAFLVWVALQLPIPFNYIVIGFVVVALVILLLNAVGGGSGVRIH